MLAAPGAVPASDVDHFKSPGGIRPLSASVVLQVSFPYFSRCCAGFVLSCGGFCK